MIWAINLTEKHYSHANIMYNYVPQKRIVCPEVKRLEASNEASGILACSCQKRKGTLTHTVAHCELAQGCTLNR